MGRIKFTLSSGQRSVFRAALSTLAAALLLSPSYALAQTEMGVEHDFSVYGTGGTTADPNLEIKGFTVFGSTQAAYAGAVIGPGSVVVNGALAVSSGAYFVGNSTFTGAGKIFINDGSTGQILRRNAAGYLEWADSTASGDNLGNHVATATLNMATFNMVDVSSVNFLSNVFLASATAAQGGGVYISTNLFVAGISSASKYYGDGSSLTGISGDNLGSHIATTTLNLSGYPLINVTTIAATSTGLHISTGGTGSILSTDGLYIKPGKGVYFTGQGNNTFIGNARGTGAVDLQTNRSAVTQVASGIYATVSGGSGNTASSQYATVSGGTDNMSSSIFATVSGGSGNTASNQYATVSGGSGNTASGDIATVSGGTDNIASGSHATVSGGYSNTASGFVAVVSGGLSNTAKGQYSWAGGYGSSSTVDGSFTWSDSQGIQNTNTVVDRTVFKNRGGFLITGSTDTSMSGTLNRGVLITGDGLVGISTGVPSAALDVVSTGTAANVYAQIWRNSAGTIVSSMTSTGVLYPQSTLAGDNLGNHTATQALNMGAYGVNTSSDISAAAYQLWGSTVLFAPGGDSYSIALGRYAGALVTSGQSNTFLGAYAGSDNTDGWDNTFVGAEAGKNNIGGTDNTMVGYQAGLLNTTGNENAFLGAFAGNANSAGGANTIVGSNAGYANTSGSSNSVFGSYAAQRNRTGSANAIFGKDAGRGLAGNSFSSSTLMGYQAGFALTTGSDNIFLGYMAGYNVTSGTGNIIIGYDQRTSAPAVSNELNIGGVLYGDLSAKTIGVSTRSPQAALDIVSTGTAHTEMAQIWRDSSGIIVASMSATGVVKAARFVGDGSALTGISGGSSGPAIDVSTINATATTPYGGVNITTNTYVQGKLGINTRTPGYALEVSAPAGTAGTMLAVSTGTSVMMEVKGTGEVISKKVTVNGGPSRISNTVGDISIEPAGSNLNVSKNITLPGDSSISFKGAGGNTYMYYDSFNKWLRVYVDGVEVARFEP